MSELTEKDKKSKEFQLGSKLGFKNHWRENEYSTCPKKYTEKQAELFYEGFREGRRCEIRT